MRWLKISWMDDLWRRLRLRNCWSICLGFWMRPWTVDSLRRYQIGSCTLVVRESYASPVPDATLDSRLREGNTYLEHSAPGVSLDCGLMEGMSRLEPLEQSVLNTLLVARPSKCVTEERSEWKPVINTVISYTLDGRLREGNTSWSVRLWRCPWTVDSWRGCRVWNHWSSRFLVRR